MATHTVTKDCLDCIYSKWDYTEAGRLHPSGDGKCTWEFPEIKLPLAFYYLHTTSSRQLPRPSGGHISRKNPRIKCPAWEDSRTNTPKI